MSRWRKDALKKKDRERKKKQKRRKERPHGGVARKNNKGIAVCSMMRASKTNHPYIKKDAMRNYITQHVPGTHLTFEQRQTVTADAPHQSTTTVAPITAYLKNSQSSLIHFIKSIRFPSAPFGGLADESREINPNGVEAVSALLHLVYRIA